MDKKLGEGTVYDIKRGMGKGKDLFVDDDGSIVIRRTDGKGESEETGLNINDIR